MSEQKCFLDKAGLSHFWGRIRAYLTVISNTMTEITKTVDDLDKKVCELPALSTGAGKAVVEFDVFLSENTLYETVDSDPPADSDTLVCYLPELAEFRPCVRKRLQYTVYNIPAGWDKASYYYPIDDIDSGICMDRLYRCDDHLYQMTSQGLAIIDPTMQAGDGISIEHSTFGHAVIISAVKQESPRMNIINGTNCGIEGWNSTMSHHVEYSTPDGISVEGSGSRMLFQPGLSREGYNWGSSDTLCLSGKIRNAGDAVNASNLTFSVELYMELDTFAAQTTLQNFGASGEWRDFRIVYHLPQEMLDFINTGGEISPGQQFNTSLTFGFSSAYKFGIRDLKLEAGDTPSPRDETEELKWQLAAMHLDAINSAVTLNEK